MTSKPQGLPIVLGEKAILFFMPRVWGGIMYDDYNPMTIHRQGQVLRITLNKPDHLNAVKQKQCVHNQKETINGKKGTC